MKKDYGYLAKNILKLVGGEENVSFVMHCATRLRFTLKDMNKANTQAIKDLKGVIDVIIKNGQYQVCIGPDVIDVFAELKKIGNFTKEDEKDKENKQEKKKPIDRFFEVVSGIFTPIVPVLMAAGMVGALLTILNVTGILPSTSTTYYVWNLIKEAGFYFLPFYVSYTASQKLGANPFLSMLLAGVLLHPQLSDFSNLGVEQLSFLGIGIKSVTYSSSILPVVLSVWLLAYVEKFFSKVCPQVIRAFSVPMLSTMVVVPIMLIIIGPAGGYLADYMTQFVQYLGNNLGFLAVGIIAALTPIMIATGTHSFAFPVIVTTLAMNGYEALIVPAMLAENIAMAGAAFAVGFKTKDKDLKAEANAATLSALLGISEPAMYGINLPRKTPFYATIIASGLGGIVAGILKLKYYAIASASFVGLPANIGEGSVMGVVYALIVIAVSFVSAFLITNILDDREGKKSDTKVEENKEQELQEKTKQTITNNNPVEIKAPLSGKAIKLSDVDDPTFSSQVMGKGIAIVPDKGELVSPVNGTIQTIFSTKHAVGITSEDGVEILMHIGVDTVQLDGKYFETKAEVGQYVKAGDPIVTFDIDAIKDAGYDVTTPVIITNTPEYLDIIAIDEKQVNKSDKIITVV